MSLTEEERRDVVKYRVEKAEMTFSHIQINIDAGYWEIVANRLYYAAYYMVSALLINNQIEAKSHDGIIRLFGQYFVATSKVSKTDGTLYSRLFSLRLKGDYNDNYNLSEDEVLPRVNETAQFIERIKTLIFQNQISKNK